MPTRTSSNICELIITPDPRSIKVSKLVKGTKVNVYVPMPDLNVQWYTSKDPKFLQ